VRFAQFIYFISLDIFRWLLGNLAGIWQLDLLPVGIVSSSEFKKKSVRFTEFPLSKAIRKLIEKFGFSAFRLLVDNFKYLTAC